MLFASLELFFHHFVYVIIFASMLLPLLQRPCTLLAIFIFCSAIFFLCINYRHLYTNVLSFFPFYLEPFLVQVYGYPLYLLSSFPIIGCMLGLIISFYVETVIIFSLFLYTRRSQQGGFLSLVFWVFIERSFPYFLHHIYSPLPYSNYLCFFSLFFYPKQCFLLYFLFVFDTNNLVQGISFIFIFIALYFLLFLFILLYRNLSFHHQKDLTFLFSFIVVSFGQETSPEKLK